MLTIVADDKIPFLKGLLEPFGTVRYLPGSKISRTDLLDADALITRTRTKCNETLLAGTKVRFIASATIGFDHIDTEYCAQNNIFWTNAPGCNAESVAQYITFILLQDAVKQKSSLQGKTLGIIGVGNVGSRIARNGRALGMRVLLNDPPRARKEGKENFTDLEVLLKESDYISCHTPLNMGGEDNSFHLADVSFFASMKKDAFFINSSRGEVCDNGALKKALLTKQIRAAALDVWENEPAVDRELLALLQCATPHIAGYSADGKSNGTAMSILSFLKYFSLEERFDCALLQKPPVPENVSIILNEDLSETEQLFQAVRSAYDIGEDDLHLREKVGDFEKLRASYPFRREFDSYRIENGSAHLRKILGELRFQLK